MVCIQKFYGSLTTNLWNVFTLGVFWIFLWPRRARSLKTNVSNVFTLGILWIFPWPRRAGSLTTNLLSVFTLGILWIFLWPRRAESLTSTSPTSVMFKPSRNSTITFDSWFYFKDLFTIKRMLDRIVNWWQHLNLFFAHFSLNLPFFWLIFLKYLFKYSRNCNFKENNYKGKCEFLG